MDDDPVRVEVDEPGISAIWPLSRKVEIMEGLPDGGARVRVHLASGVRDGRISGTTLAQRDDWDLNLRVVVSRAEKEGEEEAKQEAKIQELLEQLRVQMDKHR